MLKICFNINTRIYSLNYYLEILKVNKIRFMVFILIPLKITQSPLHINTHINIVLSLHIYNHMFIYRSQSALTELVKQMSAMFLASVNLAGINEIKVY